MNEEIINILLVEDDRDDYLLVKTYLSKLPLKVNLEWVHSYANGIDRLKQKSDFDMCFVDYHLGEKNGLDFIKEIKSRNLSQPVIMFTGLGDEQLGIQAVRAGAEDYYNKAALNAETLNRAIRFSLERAKAREQEQELVITQREKKIFSTMFEKAPAFIAVLRGKEHVIEMGNPAFFELIGRQRDVIGKPIAKALPEMKTQGTINLLNEVYQTGEPYFETESKILLDRNSNGIFEERYVNYVYQPLLEINGAVSGIFMHGFDVTEQVLYRIELQRSEERLDLAQKAGNIGTFEWLIEEDQMIWNEHLENLYGLTKGGFNGTYQDWKDRVHPEDIERVEDVLLDAAKGVGIYNSEFRIVLPDGKERWMLAKGDVFYNKKNKPARMIGVNIDITERKALERQKDDFLGIASHELKTPVTSIKAYGQVLESTFRKKGNVQAADQLEKMDAQVDKLSNLIADLLDVTKIQSGKLLFHEEEFQFNDLVEEVVEEIQRTTHRHKIVMKLAETTTLFGDRERIGQVITNLITNAIKYSPDSDEVIVTSSSEKDQVSLSVQDFGVGIPKEKQQRVFEQFFRVSGPRQETFPGLGLGLYISSEIIKREGGKLWVVSKMGKGSTFSFSLPKKK